MNFELVTSERWSTAMQVASLVMITAFFAALARSTPRIELRWWLRAWFANLAALAITLGFWYFEAPGWTEPLVRFSYLWTKTTFLWLFIQGAWSVVHPGTNVVRPRVALGAITAFALLGAILLDGVAPIGTAQHTVMALLLGFGAIMLARSGESAVTWLAAGMTIRMLLAAAEAVAYGLRYTASLRAGANTPEFATTFLSAHSSFDTAAEWLLALGCVLAVSERAQRELRNYTQQLLGVQEDLRRLVDHDALTALANRRALRDILRGVQPIGATLLFFDLDGFKEINDLHGHQTGDECLKRFATALRDSFRPDDAVVRYAGDEFLVVASGLTLPQCDERVGRLRDRLRRRKNAPPIRFSVGIAELAPGGQPEAALDAADQAMYRAKPRRARSRSGVRAAASG